MTFPATPRPALPDPTVADPPPEEWLLEALTLHGPVVLFVVCMASCLALPVPASLALITSGAIAAAGGLPLWQVALAGLAGALIGDQLAYLVGRAGRAPLVRWIDRREARQKARARAEAWIARHGGPGVLLSRWPVSPLGPYVNFAAGAAAFSWPRFTAWGAAGEVIWIGMNIGAGYVFADPVIWIAMAAQEAISLVLALAVLLALGWGLRRLLRRNSPAE
ncbi:DedA family protein [Pseudooceanicola sp. LIPI14-2-Ac024]|uniref:DedA family protein n=1 Tax=Pseudooceanicola sp. LIPI14-2-Ac024 TaxID=3344875 RepID=UPI0035CF5CB3